MDIQAKKRGWGPLRRGFDFEFTPMVAEHVTPTNKAITHSNFAQKMILDGEDDDAIDFMLSSAQYQQSEGFYLGGNLTEADKTVRKIRAGLMETKQLQRLSPGLAQMPVLEDRASSSPVSTYRQKARDRLKQQINEAVKLGQMQEPEDVDMFIKKQEEKVAQSLFNKFSSMTSISGWVNPRFVFEENYDDGEERALKEQGVVKKYPFSGGCQKGTGHRRRGCYCNNYKKSRGSWKNCSVR